MPEQDYGQQENRLYPISPLPPTAVEPTLTQETIPDIGEEEEEAQILTTERLARGTAQPETPKDDMGDLFAVPEEEDNDMYTDDLFEVEDEDVDIDTDLSDLTQVTPEDVMGRRPEPKRRMVLRRTSKPYDQPPTMGGIR